MVVAVACLFLLFYFFGGRFLEKCLPKWWIVLVVVLQNPLKPRRGRRKLQQRPMRRIRRLSPAPALEGLPVLRSLCAVFSSSFFSTRNRRVRCTTHFRTYFIGWSGMFTWWVPHVAVGQSGFGAILGVTSPVLDGLTPL